MSENLLIESLLLKKPYFGSAMRALQGDPERHRYMGAVIGYLKENQHDKEINVLEVGSWAGASAVTWAKALDASNLSGHVMCIDPWEPFLDVKSNSDRHYLDMEQSLTSGAIFRLFLHNLETTGVSGRVKHLRGRSEEVLPVVEPYTYSVVYVDGAHHYEGVLSDLKHAMALIPEGGIICGDDLELQMEAVDRNDLAADVNKGLDYTQDRASGRFYHPGVTRAVGEIFGTVGEWQGFWAIRKQNGGWVIPDIADYATDLPAHLVPFVTRDEDGPNISLPSYNVFKFQGKFIAVSKNIGAVDPMERVGNTEIFPLILVSDSMDEILQKVEKAEATGLGAHLELVEQTEHYNFIRMGKRLFAVSTSLGPVDLMAAVGTVHMPPFILQNNNEDGLRVLVNHYADLKKQNSK